MCAYSACCIHVCVRVCVCTCVCADDARACVCMSAWCVHNVSMTLTAEVNVKSNVCLCACAHVCIGSYDSDSH